MSETEPVKDPLSAVVLTITLNTDGTFNINGPIYDRGLCYSMLEMARDAIYEKSKEIERKANGSRGTSLMRKMFPRI